MKSKNTLRTKKTLLWIAFGVIATLVSFVAFDQKPADPKTIVVYKDPNCGCCNEWIKHLKRNEFNVEVHDQKYMGDIKSQLQVPKNLQSCHTARINGYTIEGHVPADVIERLINEKPEVIGLAVPGMPMGSPGMEGPRNDPYDVLTFTGKNETTIYASR